MSDEDSKPASIALVALVTLVVGVYAISIGLTVVADLVEGTLNLVGTVQFGALLFGILHLIGAYGVWQMKPWGRWIAIASASVGLLLNIATVALAPLLVFQYFIPMAIRVLVLYYLLVSPVKDLFYQDIY
ncbi:MAG: hypothetical protein ACFFED_14060 [Candidatus Thorarchaeota archaeon]